MSDIATVKVKYTIEQMDELKQLISDVNDANLYGLSQLEERIDALERRIECIERKLNHKGGRAMSITDELREYVIRVHRNGWFDRRVCDDLLEIADRIDEQHRKALEKVAAMVDDPDTWERIIEDAIGMAFDGVDDESEFDLKKMELVDRCRRLAGEA